MSRSFFSDSQIPLFPEEIFYVSQSDAAKHLGISTRTINYWENLELLHPELPRQTGKKSRKYTHNDLIELRFIKGMVVDQGYAIPDLKEKLKKLKSPYYYNPEELFWDLKDRHWKTRKEIAIGEVKNKDKKLHEFLSGFYDVSIKKNSEILKEEFIDSMINGIKETLHCKKDSL